MQASAALKLADHRDQRYTAFLLALETLLKGEFPAPSDSEELLRAIAARRLLSIHRIELTGEGVDVEKRLQSILPKDGTLRLPTITVQLIAPAERNVRVDARITVHNANADDSQNLELRRPSSDKALPLVRRVVVDADGETLRVVDGPESKCFQLIHFQDLLAAIINEPEYTARYKLSTLSMVEDLIAALKAHATVTKSATLSRKELLARQLSRIGNAVPDRSAFDSIRTDIADSIALLNRGVTEGLRRAFTSEAGVQARMFAEIDKIGSNDLAREETKKAIRLSLNRDVQNDLFVAMRDLIENDVLSVVARINNAVAELHSTVARRIHQELHVDAPRSVGDLAAEPIIERVADLLHITVKYKGTLPRRGFFQRLAEGRKSIFAVLMFFSLFGSFLGFNWRNFAAFGWLFFIGFIVAVFYTYKSWVAEDKEKIDDELEKSRDHLRMESKRVFSEVFRELQVGYAETIDSQKRNLLAGAEDLFRNVGARMQRDGQIARETAQLVVKQIELRDKQLLDFVSALSRIESDLMQLRQEISR